MFGRVVLTRGPTKGNTHVFGLLDNFGGLRTLLRAKVCTTVIEGVGGGFCLVNMASASVTHSSNTESP